MIAPSILGSDFTLLHSTLENIKRNGLSIVHFDVMDNHFVPNLTFGSQFISNAKQHSSLLFDTHLMIEHPSKWIQLYINIPVHYISIHFETLQSLDELKKIFFICQQHHIALGLAIKPTTQIAQIIPFLPYLNGIVVMTVEPGFGGQPFIETMIHKITLLHQLRAENQYQYIIEVDGGITSSYINLLYEKGADLLVMGSAYFKNQDNPHFFKTKERKTPYMKDFLSSFYFWELSL